MKKLTISIIIGILLVSALVIAGGISIKEKEVKEEDYQRLESVNSLVITVGEINCGLETCDPVNIKTGFGNTFWNPKPYWQNCTKYKENNPFTECEVYEKIYYTNEELELQRDAKIEDLKNRIISRVKMNEEKEKEVKDVKVPKEDTKFGFL